MLQIGQKVVVYLVKTCINMKIRSITNVITNSSSETFIIKNPGISEKELENILIDYHNSKISKRYDGNDDKDSEYGSGDGGIISVKSFLTIFKEEQKLYPKTKQSQFTPEMFALLQELPYEVLKDSYFLDIDEDFSATCKYIFDNYDILQHDGTSHHPIYDKTGQKIVKVINSYQEWLEETKNLTPLQCYGKLQVDNYDEESWF